MSPFLNLSRPVLLGLAEALATGRLPLPTTGVTLGRLGIPASAADGLADVLAELNHLHHQGIPAAHIAYSLHLLADERSRAQTQQDQVGLVWTGPELPGAEARDTGIVVRELFASAQHSVLISSFAIDQGAKGYDLFRPLAQRMDALPDLQVRMFLNVKRKYQDTTAASILLRRFAETFRDRVWPGRRLPEVFHDSRTMAMTADANACLHAKCVIVDEGRLIITSANFTEAAHQRNIEAGVLLENAPLARAIRSQFEMLVTQGVLQRVPGL
jgi:phosphatidylserine/phosphatidylglycerophosphate/cardiolipin synthase-like enzyme